MGSADDDDDEMDLEDSEARGLLSGGLNSEDARRRVRRRGLVIPRASPGDHAGRSELGSSPGYTYGQPQGGGKGRQWGQGPPPSYGAATRNTGGFGRSG